MFELKRLSDEAIPAALEKVLRYRLLDEPAEAESICHDVLQGRESPLADPIDFLTASPIQGCWICINRSKDQTMKGCVESPKDL